MSVLALVLSLVGLGLAIWSLVEMREARRLRGVADRLRHCSAQVRHLEALIAELTPGDWITRASLRSRQQQVLDEAKRISATEGSA